MGKRSLWRWASVAFVVAAGFRMGVAGAQEATGGQQQQNRAPDADIQTERRANLSGPEQIREAARIIDNVTGLRRRVSDMLDRARQERDIIKVNCLNDKLTQIDVTLRSAREHQDLLQTAVGLNNDGQRNHEYALITIFRQRSESLEAEARQCIGEEAGAFGEGTTVTVRVNPNIPEQDTTQYPINPVVPEVPTVLSPVR
jgi:hypothetical protein